MPNPIQYSDITQKEQDCRDIWAFKTKKLTDFPDPVYQQELKDFYRFSATRFNSDEEVNVNRTPDTLDIV
jgi:hypothetical protein